MADDEAGPDTEARLRGGPRDWERLIVQLELRALALRHALLRYHTVLGERPEPAGDWDDFEPVLASVSWEPLHPGDVAEQNIDHNTAIDLATDAYFDTFESVECRRVVGYTESDHDWEACQPCNDDLTDVEVEGSEEDDGEEGGEEDEGEDL